MKAISLALSSGLIIASGSLFCVVYAVVPEFEKLFSGFDVGLPAFTQFFLGTHQFVVLLPLVLIVPFMLGLVMRSMSLGSVRALRGYAVRTFFVSVAVLISCIVAMYLPIWRMGAVI